jgi:hypothetical protein
MKQIFNIKNVLIVLLIGIALLEFINPGGFMPKRTVTVAQVDSIPYAVHDTIPYETEVEVEVPVPYEVEKVIHDTVPMAVDTLAILSKLYAKNEVKETLTLPNGLGTVALKETISENKVIARSFDAKVKQKVVKDTIYTPEMKVSQLYVGFDANFDKPNVVRLLGLGLILKDKSDKLYKLSAGVNNTVVDGLKGEFQPYVGGGIYWKIKSNKKK